MPVGKRGFTLVEAMIVVMVIAILAAIGMASHMRAREASQEVVCAGNRRSIEHAERQFMFDTSGPSATIQQLEDSGYLKRIEWCPAGGDYAWVECPEDSPLFHCTIACSIHGTGDVEEDE